jgi:hypothetical protein
MAASLTKTLSKTKERESMPRFTQGSDPLDGRRLEAAKLEAIRRNNERAVRNAVAAREMQEIAQLSAGQAEMRRAKILTDPTFKMSDESEELLQSAQYLNRVNANQIPSTQEEQIEFSQFAISLVNEDLAYNDKEPALTLDELRLVVRFMGTRGMLPNASSMLCSLMALRIENLFRPAAFPTVVIKAPAEEMEPLPVGEYDNLVLPPNPYPEFITRRGQEVRNPQFDGFAVNARAQAIQEHDRRKMKEDARREISPLVKSTMQEISDASGLIIPQSVITETLECFDTARPRLLFTRENLRACFIKRFFKQFANPENVFTADEIKGWHQDNYRGSAEDFAKYFQLGNPGMGSSDAPTFTRQRG